MCVRERGEMSVTPVSECVHASVSVCVCDRDGGGGGEGRLGATEDTGVSGMEGAWEKVGNGERGDDQRRGGKLTFDLQRPGSSQDLSTATRSRLNVC